MVMFIQERLISRRLKGFEWTWNEDRKELWLIKNPIIGEYEDIHIDKVRMFSLMRFLIRVCQRLSARRKNVNKT